MGGTFAVDGEFPFVVSLIIMSPQGVPSLCGGSLYNERTVITAAHCLQNYKTIEAFVGTTSLFSMHPIYVSDSIVHSGYNSRTQANDIALLKLSKAAKFNDYVQPICLSSVAETEGEQTVAMGWGLTQERGSISYHLQKATVPVIDSSKCREMSGYPLDETMICAGYEDGMIDSCQGDSGGPLVVQRDGVFELVGVVSYGSGCARPNRPGVYADAYFFKDFITENAFS